MTKAELYDCIRETASDLTQKEAADVVETILDTIKETLAAGENVKISGFGSFMVRDKKARMGRNPANGEPLMLEARRVVTFKASPGLRDGVKRSV
jgi:integration host factor subunit alpha